MFKNGYKPPISGNGRGAKLIHDNVNHDGDECLIWPMFRDDKGYGRLGHNGKHIKAHRLMLILSKGEPPTRSLG